MRVIYSSPRGGQPLPIRSEMLARTIAPLVAVNVDRDHQESVSLSVRSITTVEFIECDEITPFLDARAATVGFLIALSSARRVEIDEMIRRVRRARRAMPIIAYATDSDDWASRAVRAIQAGADHLAVHGIDDLRRVVARALIDGRLAHACAETLRLVLPSIPSRAHGVLEFCTLHAAQPLSVVDVAVRLGSTPRSVNRLLHALGLPVAAATISWCRLFVAVYLLAHEHQRADQVAGALGFASGSGLRNMLRRYTGLTPAALRTPDAVARLATLYTMVSTVSTSEVEERCVSPMA